MLIPMNTPLLVLRNIYLLILRSTPLLILRSIYLLILMSIPLAAVAQVAGVTAYVDPRIGSEGLGRVFVGPSCPYGMVKPSPDCTVHPNSGWLPMPEQVNGFAQLHVSGTGGGPKYGNILVMPFGEGMDRTDHADRRKSETIRLGYYATTLQRTGITAEMTTARRASFYRFTYPKDSLRSLLIDAGFFLGEDPVPDAREAQQFVGSEVQIVSDREVMGYSRIRGGWNNGRAYTVYFYAVTDRPFRQTATWKGEQISPSPYQTDTQQKTGALLRFSPDTDTLQLKVGISFISSLKARENAQAELPHWEFDTAYKALLSQWEELLGRIEIDRDTPDSLKRMFYTGMYHTMLMPVDRTGENPLWSDNEPYYDDYYAIWDTYRTSTPLITLIDPQRETDIVRSLIDIYRRDGYMPDARSGNCNGRTQGGSNAEIVIADAMVKGLTGIDYRSGLEAMLKDATVPPGGNEEAEGRGGLLPYLELGYVPYGIPRAGTRTVEYAFCDYAIAVVAKGLGEEELYRRYLRQSANWKNLWRADYEHGGAKGFILPRDKEGRWLDRLPYGRSRIQHPTFTYTPLTFEGPWYTPWWSMFFYEASSWEYSLSVPHDVPGLIEQCGGTEAFEQRLDTFFACGYYNVNNEPSFLTPCLYHWIDRPDKSSDCVRQIIDAHYNDSPAGLPGNDDSGAMSSWFVFHATGLYPNAGHDYYLIHTPLLRQTTFHLQGGNTFTVKAEGLSAKNRYIQSVLLNGKEYPYSSIRHSDILGGGELLLKMGKRPVCFPLHPPKEEDQVVSSRDVVQNVRSSQVASSPIPTSELLNSDFLNKHALLVFRLHGQTRRYHVTFTLHGDTLRLDWGIERNMKWQSGSYAMPRQACENARRLSFLQPEDGRHVCLPSDETFCLLSAAAYRELKEQHRFRYNDTDYTLTDTIEEAFGYPLLHVTDTAEGCEMWISDNPRLPLIQRMSKNPLGIDWTILHESLNP